jgi:hypothetical protein
VFLFRNEVPYVVGQDRERQHVRGEAQPLYGVFQDSELMDSVPQGIDSVRMSDMGGSSGVVSTVMLLFECSCFQYFSKTL